MPDIRMRTNRLRNGMIIKNNVYASSGAILIPHDTPVTKDIITLLSKHFIDYVIVDYQTKSNLPAPELPPEPPKISRFLKKSSLIALQKLPPLTGILMSMFC